MVTQEKFGQPYLIGSTTFNLNCAQDFSGITTISTLMSQQFVSLPYGLAPQLVRLLLSFPFRVIRDAPIARQIFLQVLGVPLSQRRLRHAHGMIQMKLSSFLSKLAPR